jgi:hypothetical protein
LSWRENAAKVTDKRNQLPDMRDDQFHFLTLLGQLPARLTTEQAAWVLNCQAHDVPVLVSARLLKPLGNPQPNSVKYFAAAEIIELTKDRAWLAKMTNAVSQHWKQKNQRKAVHLRRGVEIGQPMEFILPA